MTAIPGARRWAERVAWTSGGALVAWLLVGAGFANYDTFYGLVWGRELAGGELPDYTAPIAPTPKPLVNAAGAVLAPLGHDAEVATVAFAFAALGALGYIVFRLGQAWFCAPVGALAAAIVLTREPVLSFGVRAYVDIPYVALVLGALLAETRRPKRGTAPLVLLSLAGLLRPEAWLFSAAYLVYLAPSVDRRRLLALLPVAAGAPVIWMVADLVVTGSPLYSLTGTRETAEELGRRTGLANVPATVPRRLGEILREPALIAAAGGGLLSLAFLRRRVQIGAAAGVLSLVAFCVFAAAGLPLLGRYLLLPAAILAIFAAAGALGWLALPRDHPFRLAWAGFGVVALAVSVLFVPGQVRRIDRLSDSIAGQQRIRDDLHDLADAGTLGGCRPLVVPTHRPVPLLSLWLDREPRTIVGGTSGQARGVVVTAASPEVERLFVLDPRDPARPAATLDPALRERAGNRSWRVLTRC